MGRTSNVLTVPAKDTRCCVDNSGYDFFERSSGRKEELEMNVNIGPGSFSINCCQIHGTVEIINAYAEISKVTTLTNLTGLYWDLWDGTLATDITANGADISGMPVGTFFIKNKDAANVVTVCDASTGVVLEADASKKTHQPFILTQKSGVDTFIRINFTTTDSPLDFDIKMIIEWRPKDGGYIESV